MDDASRHADEHAIRDLIDRYADAVNRRDAGAWAALWTEDAIWEVFGRAIEGREAVVAAWSAVMQGLRLVFHSVHGGVVEVGADTATARFSVSEQLQTSSGEPALLLGLYHDHFRRESGEWRIARRRLQVLYQGAPDLKGTPSA
jgi:uncharacterized protein (TIGR02246 family)